MPIPANLPDNPTEKPPRHRHVGTAGYPAWLVAIALAAIWWALQWGGGPSAWGFDRAAIQHGQIWRLLSAHAVHLNLTHLALNLLGLTAILSVWSNELRGLRLPLLFLAGATAASAGLWWGHPELAHYAGASGALHGLFAAGLILATTTGRLFRLAAAGALLLKLALEPHLGGGAAEMIGAPVIYAAHQWGALGGGLGAALWRLTARARSSAPVD
ncbi:MAG: rhombosortase [Pseudomonadota bacterium]